MDKQDKIYLWMAIVSLLAVLVGIGFSLVHAQRISNTAVQPWK